MQWSTFNLSLGYLALLVGLTLPTLFPEVANVSYLALAGLALIVSLRSTNWPELLKRPAVWMPLLGGALLLVAFTVTAKSYWHPLTAFVFAPLFVTAPIIALFGRARRAITPANVGIAATIGVVGAAGLAVYETWILGLTRAGISVNNPIHFAAIVLTLGFLALAGLFGTAKGVKPLVMAALPLALLAVLLSGSRGPQVAAVVMLLLSAAALQRGSIWRRIRPLHIAGLAVAVIAAAIVAWQFGLLDRALSMVALLKEMSQSDVSDTSTTLRLEMYQAAANAFMASPIVGHGLVDYVAIAGSYAAPGIDLPASGHLHNDFADFSVAGGLFGIVTYCLFLLAPVVEALRCSSNNRALVLFIAIVSAGGYFAMGLTNAMFGILSQTVLYAFLTALVSYLAHDEAGA